MLIMRCASIAPVLILIAALTVIAGCTESPQAKAYLEGIASVDLVSGGGSIVPDGQKDGLFSLRLDAGGTIAAIEVHNVDGQTAIWDTIPDNPLWVVGVADKQNPEVLLNRPDGSVEIKMDKPRDFLLYVADNGAIRDGKTRFAVIVSYAGGTKKEIAAEQRND